MSKKTVILRHNRAAGDIIVMTAAVRDIYKAHHETLEIGVETSFSELWKASRNFCRFPPPAI